jgi:hypothetical protein
VSADRAPDFFLATRGNHEAAPLGRKRILALTRRNPRFTRVLAAKALGFDRVS